MLRSPFVIARRCLLHDINCRTFHASRTTLAAGEVTSNAPSRRKSPPSVINGQFKTYKPVSPGIRHLKRPVSEHLFEGGPMRALTKAKRKKGGRNKAGHITVRSVGGGHKQRIRLVDFHRFDGGKQDVVRIEYDPGRSAHIALVKSRDPNAKRLWSYILAPENLRAGDVVESFRAGIPDGLVPGFVDERRADKKARSDKAMEESPRSPNMKQLRNVFAELRQQDLEALDRGGEAQMQPPMDPLDPSSPQTVQPPIPPPDPNVRAFFLDPAENPNARPPASSTAQLSLGLLRTITIQPGNVLPLRLIPPGVNIHSISLNPFGPGKLVRSAGSFGQVIAHNEDGKYSQVKLQSGEVRLVGQDCIATIGRVSNPDWKHRQLGKAGRSRNLGIRPHVRGVAMNAVDHPHGGGRGKSKGNKHPRSIYGWLTKGKRTRKPGPNGHKGSNQFVIKERPRGKERRN